MQCTQGRIHNGTGEGATVSFGFLKIVFFNNVFGNLLFLEKNFTPLNYLIKFVEKKNI
jgi:hypothetical protein